MSDLKSYLFSALKRSPGFATAAMAELTMNPPSILTSTFVQKEFSGLKDKADEIAHDVLNLFRINSIAKMTNILAVDFFRSMGAVRAAFIWNERMSDFNQKDPTKTDCDPKEFSYDSYYQHNEFQIENL